MAIVITPNVLPPAQALTAYSQQLSASGGSSPYTWKLISGSLPPGLALSTSGLIAGTPTLLAAPGFPTAYSFTVQATDSTGLTQTQVF